ncbi:MAG TPA: FAD-dependent oxidoreductase [Terriglobales bacterium]|nr:FAD-dependent oxidoreductase [Terriglobales bacterium]
MRSFVMNPDSGSTLSVWMDSPAPANERNPLAEDLHTEVCIVGAGIAGLSVAYQLTKAGKQVVVLDDGPIGGGETCRTTAHLSNAIDDRYFHLLTVHGEENTRLAADSHTRAIDEIERTVRLENIDCDFERLDGFLFDPPNGARPNKANDQLNEELNACHRAGLTQVKMVGNAPIENFNTGPALRFPAQGQFHILKYLHGLANAIEAKGGRIFTETHVASIQGGSPAIIKTSNGFQINAGAVVVATNVPVNDRVEVHTKQMPYRSYVIGARIPKGSVTRALYWDTADPYHYVRLQSIDGDDAEEILIIGGEDHKTGQANDGDSRFDRLEHWARERWPQITSVDYRWSGQVIETQDGLTFIGRNPLDNDNVFIATGDSGMGMTHGTIAGMLISDLILGRTNPWEKLYDPRRIRVLAADEFVKENLNTFAQYKAYFTPADVQAIKMIAPGEGALIRRGLSKVAVYKEASGAVTECSAVCPHLGAIVQWNSLEKTWDCPAHGSRFDCFGKVVNGPANGGLTRLDEVEEKRTA